MYASGLLILRQFLLLYLFTSEAIAFGQDQIRYSLLASKPVRSQAQLLGNRVVGIGNITKLENITASDGHIQSTEFHFDQFSPRRSASVNFTLVEYWKHYKAKTGNLGPYELNLTRLSGFEFTGHSRRFLIVIHGFLSHRKAGWKDQIREKWLKLDGNAGGIAIRVTWGRIWTYDRAVANTVLVARQVTIMLHYMALLSGTHLMDPDFLARVHIVGHSLGAHVAGFVGKDLEGKLGRITALDPAGPVFFKLPNHQRLHRTDARLVEVLHTNSGRMGIVNGFASAALGMVPSTSTIQEWLTKKYTGEGDAFWFGIDAQLGHVDYYANNGRTQPGCEGLVHICDHCRAPRIYLDLLSHAGSSLRQSNSAVSSLAEVNRLRAFKSFDFESFAVGHSFVQHCPQLMDIETHLNGTAVQQALDQCSVPLFDITKPLEEVIDELKTKHGIDFGDGSGTSGNGNDVNESDKAGLDDNGQLEPSAALRKRPSFYFKTTPSEGDLVGDHFLLKIYLTKPASWYVARCSLEVQIIMPDGDKIRLESRRLSHPDSSQTILAMLFVYHNSFKPRERFNRLITLDKNMSHHFGPAEMDEFPRDGGYMASSEFTQDFCKLFPKKIRLKLAEPKPSGITVYNLQTQVMESDGEVSPLCRLTTDMIEVQPLIYGLEKNFAALYGRDLLLSGDRLQVISTSEQLRLRQNPSKRETKLTSEINSFTYGLESAVVG